MSLRLPSNNNDSTMASRDSSNTSMQQIIKEVDDLQLPEAAKGYFTEVSVSHLIMSPMLISNTVAQTHGCSRPRMDQSGQDVGKIPEPLEKFQQRNDCDHAEYAGDLFER